MADTGFLRAWKHSGYVIQMEKSHGECELELLSWQAKPQLSPRLLLIPALWWDAGEAFIILGPWFPVCNPRRVGPSDLSGQPSP